MPKPGLPQTWKAQRGVPNGFLEYLNKEKGEQLHKYLDTVIPTQPQERFEESYYWGQVGIVGDGLAVADFDFTPPPGTPDLRLLWIGITNEATVARRYALHHFRQAVKNGGDFTFVIGDVLLNLGAAGVICNTQPNEVIDSLNVQSQRVSGPFDLWNSRAGFKNDRWQVASTAPITAVDVVTVTFLAKAIPPPAQAILASNMLVGTP